MPHRMKDEPPVWKSLYSSRSAYGLEDMSTSEMLSLFKRMEQNQGLRDKYCSHKHRLSNYTEWSECRDDCKLRSVQEIRVISPIDP